MNPPRVRDIRRRAAASVTVCVAVAALLAIAAGWRPAALAAPGEGVQEPNQSGPPPGARPLGDGLIVPGQRIGPVRLNMTPEQIIEAVGAPPKREEFAEDGIVLYEWRAQGLWVSQSIATRAVRVISVFGTSDRYKTDKGVGLLYTRGQMETAYGKTYKEYAYPQDRITLIRYPDLGLQFGLVNQPGNRAIHNRIFQIGVFKPGDLPPLRRPSR